MDTFIFDGKECTEDGITLAKYLCACPEGTNKLYGFSGEKQFLSWAVKKGLSKEIKNLLIKEKAARKEINGMTEKTIDQLAKKRSEEATAKFTEVKAILKKNKVKLEDSKGIVDLFHKGIIGSAVLYSKVNCKGSSQFLLSGVPYPNFKWLLFNDKACSGIAGFTGCFLFEHTLYRGTCYYVYPFQIIPGADINFGGFNQKASSAIL